MPEPDPGRSLNSFAGAEFDLTLAWPHCWIDRHQGSTVYRSIDLGRDNPPAASGCLAAVAPEATKVQLVISAISGRFFRILLRDLTSN